MKHSGNKLAPCSPVQIPVEKELSQNMTATRSEDYMVSMDEPTQYFQYSKRSDAKAICKGHANSKDILFLLHGLGDGPFSLSYSHLLTSHFLLIQATMRSSYGGFGMVTLDEDAEDFDALLNSKFVKNLIAEKKGEGRVFFMGHSTGCQSILRYLETKTPPTEMRESGIYIVLQGAVSDRQCLPDIKNFDYALIPDLNEIIPDVRVLGHPVSYKRYRDLTVPGALDDFFSTDDKADCVGRTLHALDKPFVKSVLFLYGDEDEYLGDKNMYRAFLDKLRQANLRISACEVPGRNHCLTGCIDIVDTILSKNT